MADAIVKERIYHGLYRHSADSKRRVPIPFRWRPEKSEEAIEFTLMTWAKHQAGTCLRVLPPDQMAKLRAAIDAMANNDPNKSVLKRSIGSSSVPLKLDSVGRITIPDEMAEAAGITSEVVMVGMMDRFEIWSPARHARAKALDDAILARALDQME